MADKQTIISKNLPQHIGIIMDGNGRWATMHGKSRKFGHREGAKVFKKITGYAKKIGIKYITYYAFSTENWKRPKDEVDELMHLFETYLDDIENYTKENIRVIFIGDRSKLSDTLINKMNDLEERSKNFNAMTLILAINYGGQDEIVHSVKKIAELIENGFLKSKDIDKDIIRAHLYTAGIPDVDLVIRPSGELRLSNFLLWQSAYSEFYFSDVLWPDFKPKDLDKALESYSERSRRFGGIK